MAEVKETNVPPGIYFRGVHGQYKKYPVWRYHKYWEPTLVHDTVEDDLVQKAGYSTLFAPLTSHKGPLNCFWDFEDMSPKQLVVYAREKFDIDLPLKAGQTILFKAVVKLTKFAPENRNRLIMMAHTVKLNHDEAMSEIKRLSLEQINPQYYEREIITEIIEL